jgi:hypothetical protein
MIDLQNLDFVKTHPPTTMAAIEAAEKALNLKFPKDYIELLLCSNGLDAETTWTVQYYPSMEIKEEPEASLNLDDIQNVVENNIYYEVQHNSPNSLLIGVNGGSDGFMLDCSLEKSPVYNVGDGGFFLEDGKEIAENIEDWINKKFRSRTDSKIEYPEKCDLYMIKAPESGAKELLNIKKTLEIDTSIGDIYRGVKTLPYLIKKNACFSEAAKFSAIYNKIDDCFRTFEPGSTTKEIPIPPWFYE